MANEEILLNLSANTMRTLQSKILLCGKLSLRNLYPSNIAHILLVNVDNGSKELLPFQ